MKVVNKEEYETTIKEGLTLVDFFADWCGPCKALGPVLEDVSNDYPDVKFIKVNVDDETDIAAELGIMSIPAVVLFKNGEIVFRTVGYRPREEWVKVLDSNK